MELSKNYIPATTEDKWYKHWTEKKYFESTPDERSPFTVVIPPPNVTGVLHMGHTLNETVQDILVRKARMSGYNACWVPGSDHASIATEAKVVQMLREKGIDKNTLSREEFLQYAFEWKEKYGNIIYHQITKLGCSVDWKRVSFTMDDHYYKAVMKVFVEMYNNGLLYRGARMIHWDVAAKTALSDEEVEYKDVQGKLYYVKYMIVEGEQPSTDDRQPSTDDRKHLTDDRQLTTEIQMQIVDGRQLTADDNSNYILVATQRPETIMGDVAVCVNPNDERYKHLHGKKVIVPLINKAVPIITDEYVDINFGTGALKITPAHDIHDYEIGLKHKLEVIDTLTEEGKISEAGQVFVGLDRFEARKKAVEQLKADGLLIKEEDYTTRLGYSQRTNVVVEPRISTQWFVKMKELAGPALNAVMSGDITIHPGEKFLATYKYWLENVKDWCISRQLWWGQQIPAWYDENGNCFVAETEEEALLQSSKLNAESSKLVRDADVLDTWFSSWLWPIEVFGGITNPNNQDINYYYPTNVLVTGQDIIFFWVARMIMAGMQFKNAKPFGDVYFTGMVRDKLGRKMSKQLGNSPDLLELIDKYGADAVRFGIMISSPAGNDLLFDEAALEQGRNFNNKLWNALKLLKMWEGRRASGSREDEKSGSLEVGESESREDGKSESREVGELESWKSGITEVYIHNSQFTIHNFAIDWFENRLREVRSEVEELMKSFKLSEALKTIYSLIWDDFCSWYLEWIKPGFEQPIEPFIYKKTIHFFEDLLQLLHPYMPFITEEIYHLLEEKNDDLCVKQYYAIVAPNQVVLQEGALLKQAITAVRDARNKNGLKPKETIALHIQTADAATYKATESILLKQINAQTISYTSEAIANTIIVVLEKDKFYIEAHNAIDTTALKTEMLKDKEYQQKFIESVMKKLSNEKFVQNAKPEVVALERKKKEDAEARIKTIEESLINL